MNYNLSAISSTNNTYIPSNYHIGKHYTTIGQKAIDLFKKGNKIHIKKANRGKFTDYCGGKVTLECINRGKNSPNPKIRKRATFAANARKWKHLLGGIINTNILYIIDNFITNYKK